ncbi:MAG: hypothetical protein GYA18_02960 [Chloroflexi bacterium]|jgi:hypothetical protein|nr:hypothetical protein [Chloroflexota bacterium]
MRIASAQKIKKQLEGDPSPAACLVIRAVLTDFQVRGSSIMKERTLFHPIID